MPISCRVIGSVKRALGQYQKGSRLPHMGLEYHDNPPSLKVSKYVRLYECREAIDTKSFLVHPDDILVEDLKMTYTIKMLD